MYSTVIRLTFCLHITHKITSSIWHLRLNQHTVFFISWSLMNSKCWKSDWMKTSSKNSSASAHFSSVSQSFLCVNQTVIFTCVWITADSMISLSKIIIQFLSYKKLSIIWLRSLCSSNLTLFQFFINFTIRKMMNEKLHSASDMKCLNH